MHPVTTDLARCYAMQMIKLKQLWLHKRLQLIFLISEQQKVIGQAIRTKKSAVLLLALSNRLRCQCFEAQVVRKPKSAFATAIFGVLLLQSTIADQACARHLPTTIFYLASIKTRRAGIFLCRATFVEQSAS